MSISEDGTFTKSSANAKKMMYGGMLNLRSLMILLAHKYIAKLGVIAARYAFKRRQFQSNDGPNYPETRIIHYQMQQFKIVPVLTYAWTILYVQNQLYAIYDEYQKGLEKTNRGEQADTFSILAELHGLVSGFKALTTWDGEKFSEIIKQACGGHGFTDWSGIHKIHSDFGFGWQMTEGDNTVMA